MPLFDFNNQPILEDSQTLSYSDVPQVRLKFSESTTKELTFKIFYKKLLESGASEFNFLELGLSQDFPGSEIELNTSHFSLRKTSPFVARDPAMTLNYKFLAIPETSKTIRAYFSEGPLEKISIEELAVEFFSIISQRSEVFQVEASPDGRGWTLNISDLDCINLSSDYFKGLPKLEKERLSSLSVIIGTAKNESIHQARKMISDFFYPRNNLHSIGSREASSSEELMLYLESLMNFLSSTPDGSFGPMKAKRTVEVIEAYKNLSMKRVAQLKVEGKDCSKEWNEECDKILERIEERVREAVLERQASLEGHRLQVLISQ